MRAEGNDYKIAFLIPNLMVFLYSKKQKMNFDNDKIYFQSGMVWIKHVIKIAQLPQEKGEELNEK